MIRLYEVTYRVTTTAGDPHQAENRADGYLGLLIPASGPNITVTVAESDATRDVDQPSYAPPRDG